MGSDLLLILGIKGQPELDRFNKSLGETPKRARRAGQALDQFGEESLRATRKTKRFAAVGLQQLGYQVGDFAVQVQGGTNAFVAFGQQGSQLLGILGPLGAVAGALLAIFTAFAAAMSNSEDSTGRAAAEFAKLKGEFEPLLTISKELLSILKEMAYDTLNVLANNLQLVISYATAAVLVWGGKAGLTAAISLATLAVTNFGKVVRGVLVGTVVGAAIVGLGYLINQFLQLREAVGSWGETFSLIKDVIDGFVEDAGTALNNWYVNTEVVIMNLKAAFAEGMANIEIAFVNVIARLQAAWDTGFQVISNVAKSVMYNVQLAIDTAIDAVLLRFKQLFELAAKLPFEVGEGFRGMAAITGGFMGREPTLPTYDKGSFEDFFAERLSAFGSDFGRGIGTAAGIRKAIEELKETKRVSGKTAEALGVLMDKINSLEETATGFDIRNLFTGLGEGVAEEVSTAVEELEKLQEKTDDLREKIAGDFARTIVDSFKSVVNGTKTVGEAFRDMALQIIQQIMDILIWQPLIKQLTAAFTPMMGQGLFGAATSFLASANGNAFSNGKLIPFANGGVVGSPTYFGMAGGRMGVMGEAGPEAILPLKRGPGGKLGVEGGGSVVVNQTFQFAANGDESVKKIIAEAAPKIAKMTEAQIINSRQRGGQMRRAFS